MAAALTASEMARVRELFLQRAAAEALRNKLGTYFPETGPYRRELYKKHLEFFAAGAAYKERLFMAANRIGKSESGAYESVCHSTGLYPKWWVGRRFEKAGEGWACGTTGETTRDIVQEKLLGPVGKHGTGMIPADRIVKVTSRRGGIADALESIHVRHVSGDISVIGLKSYQQGRESFEGTAKQWVWFDEEPPQDVYTEGLYRTVTTRGIVYTTFTPLQGMSDVVRGFVEPENDDSAAHKFFVQAGWNDVPHIHEDEKAALIRTTPPYQIKARTEGEPALGSGAIYPIAESDISVPATFIPPGNWPRAYAMDVGWNRTAVLWAARNPATGQVIIYDEYYQGMGEPPSHALGIKGRGEWIPGVIDPASRGRSQVDGSQLMVLYRRLGLHLTVAENAVESGIQDVWTMLVSGQLKIS
jgi:phage terminase large subunit-like protein